MNLVLIGYRGSGKTTVGRIIAERHDAAFIDTDELIEHVAGKSIADIFADGGETDFRDREKAAIKMATSRPDRVVSVGGGAVEFETNRVRIRRYGTVVWLEAPAEDLWRRIERDPQSSRTRPDLAGGGLEEVRAVLNRRAPLYAATAHFAVRVIDRTPDQVAADIEAWLDAARPE